MEFPQPNFDKLMVRGYITAFVDLLGLSNNLRLLDRIPAVTDSRERSTTILRPSLGAIYGFRRVFEQFYLAFEETKRDNVIEGLSDEQRRVFNETRIHNSVISWFSDCVIISVPVDSKSDISTMNGAYMMLGSIASASITMLALGQTMRGGVEIGFGTELYKGEVLSSGLSKAYALEHSVAKSPRVLVGRELRAVLQSHADGVTSTPRDQIAKSIAALANSLLQEDDDGEVFVNPFGTGLLQTLPHSHRIHTLYKAVGFAMTEHDRFARTNDERRHKYNWLLKWIGRLNLDAILDNSERVPEHDHGDALTV